MRSSPKDRKHGFFDVETDTFICNCDSLSFEDGRIQYSHGSEFIEIQFLESHFRICLHTSHVSRHN